MCSKLTALFSNSAAAFLSPCSWTAETPRGIYKSESSARLVFHIWSSFLMQLMRATLKSRHSGQRIIKGQPSPSPAMCSKSSYVKSLSEVGSISTRDTCYPAAESPSNDSRPSRRHALSGTSHLVYGHTPRNMPWPLCLSGRLANLHCIFVSTITSQNDPTAQDYSDTLYSVIFRVTFLVFLSPLSRHG
jgi:hypothetical protein